MVFYRKYRPQTIDDLDSAAVRETLTSVLQNLPSGRQGDVPHAFLFTGPKGLGKTSTARILAKAVNCEERNQESGVRSQGIEPCNKCEQCVSITKGTNIDTLEIDAASNRGIDEIRDLKEKIRLTPVSSLKKVYIIDEVHMLTTEAFNALLKTLEEPPEHAMFILCTTEPQKVPSTILSRCFHISFHLATPEELVRSFNRIIATEKAEVDPEALVMIAKLADGGFRDGVKMLEEVITLAGGKKVTKEFLEEKFKVSSIKYFVFSMIEALAERDAQNGLQVIAKLADQGVDMKYFLQQLMETLHQMLLKQANIQNTKYEIPNTQLSMDEIKILFTLLSRAFGEMRNAVLPQLPLELVVLEWCSSVIPTEVEESHTTVLVKKSGEGDPSALLGMTDDVTVHTLRKQVGDIKRKEALYGAPKKAPVSEDEEVTVKTSTVELMHTSGDGEVTKEWLDHFWKNLINEVKKHNHTVAGVLRGCVIKQYSQQQLVIEAGYKFHKERLDDIKNMDELLRICKALTGNDMQITVELRK